MADKSNIEWTDATWNPITGCTLVNDGCKHCYAAHLIATWPAIGNHPSRKGLARVNAQGEAKFTGEVRFNEQWLDQPIRWRKPRKIFVCAHGDLFHESVPDEWIDRIFVVMAITKQHTYQILTKRPERAARYLNDAGRVKAIMQAGATMMKSQGQSISLEVSLTYDWPLSNVWLGTSISDQATADTMIPHLLAAPAAVRFLSVEPMLGPVDLRWATGHPFSIAAGILSRGHFAPGLESLRGIDWVICGGESGPKARPMHPDWARDLRDQCRDADVAFFMKQMGGNRKPFPAIPDDLMIRQMPKVQP